VDPPLAPPDEHNPQRPVLPPENRNEHGGFDHTLRGAFRQVQVLEGRGCAMIGGFGHGARISTTGKTSTGGQRRLAPSRGLNSAFIRDFVPDPLFRVHL
jgi:hypothetical protein